MKTTNSSKITRMAIIAAILFFGKISFAQTGFIGTEEGDKTSLDKSVFGLGVNFSLMSGSGISFKQHFPHSPFSYMASGYVWKDENGSAYNYGAELQYDIYMKEQTRFYITAGASYYYAGGTSYQYNAATGSNLYGSYSSEHNILRGPLRIGGGVGIETALSSVVGFYCNLSLTSFQPSGDMLIIPYGGFMIYFK